jgi:hypothetical protein
MASDQNRFDNFINLIMFNPINYYPSSEVLAAKPGFLARQIRSSPSSAQLVFDVSFGVVAPVLCFLFHPIVFHSGLLGPPLFPSYQTFVYLFSGCQIFLLCFWLLRGPRSEFGKVVIGAALFAGGMFCMAIGLLLAPFSVLGLVLLLGFLGFVPFVTAIVYLRNGWRALSPRTSGITRFSYVAAFVLGVTLTMIIPTVASLQIRHAVTKSVDEILYGDTNHAASAAQRLKVLKFVATADVDRIVDAYIAESDPSRKEILKNTYREITGEDIEHRARIIQD